MIDQPETSRIAYQKSHEFKADHQKIILALIEDWPGSTMGELAERSKLGKARVARRLKEMEVKDLIYRDGKRKCTCSECDSQQLQWWPERTDSPPVDAEPQQKDGFLFDVEPEPGSGHSFR